MEHTPTEARRIELAGQIEEAARANDLGKIHGLLDELAQLDKTFADCWNYEGKQDAPAKGGFNEAWGFVPGRRGET